MSDIKRFMAPGPWVTRDLKECVLASDYDALRARVAELEAAQNVLQKSFEQECGDVDTLLVLLQLTPHDYRSDAGWLLLRKIHAVIAERNAERDALREQLAKSCSEDQRHAFGGCPIANGLAARVAELEAALYEARDSVAECMNHATRPARMAIYHAELERIDKLLEGYKP